MYRCYSDAMGNFPCDNGAICDTCLYTDVEQVDCSTVSYGDIVIGKAYIDRRYFGLMEEYESIYVEEVESLVWDWLNGGYYVEVLCGDKTIRYSPDLMEKALATYNYVTINDCIDD